MNHSKLLARLTLVIALALLVSIGLTMPVAAQEDETARVDVILTGLDTEFGAIGDWEASLYAGPTEGEETDGRFTEWITAEAGQVTLMIPDDLTDDATVPWDETNEVYVRIRTTNDDAYPTFDLVTQAFTLSERYYTVEIELDYEIDTTSQDDTVVEISLNATDITFGEIDAWEASLYEGATPGEETDGRFTEWIEADNDTVTINLPEDLDNDEAPFDVQDDVYVRLRSLNDAYPEFDVVTPPFTLVENELTEISLSVTTSVRDEALPEDPEPVEPAPVEPTPPAPPVERPPVPLPEDPTGYSVYTVVAGDTLSNIAFRAYGDARRFPEIVRATNSLAPRDARLNRIFDPNVLRIGWNIAIPGPQFRPEPVVAPAPPVDPTVPDVDETIAIGVPTPVRFIVGDQAGAFDTYLISFETTTDVAVSMSYAPAGPLYSPGVGFNVWGEGRRVAESDLVNGQLPEEAVFTALAGEVYEIQVYNYIHGQAVGYQLTVTQ